VKFCPDITALGLMESVAVGGAAGRTVSVTGVDVTEGFSAAGMQVTEME
jgi:hypothetical protein